MRSFAKAWLIPPRLFQKIAYTRAFIASRQAMDKVQTECRDIEKGNRCFIVGTGSSINQQDLTLLQGEIVIGVSGLFHHDAIQEIRPKYYVNPPIFKSHRSIHGEAPLVEKLHAMDSALREIRPTYFFDVSDQETLNRYALFQNQKIIWKNYLPWNGDEISQIDLRKMPNIKSVSESAIQIALFLGFDKIYLLGFDHDWYHGLFNYFDNSKVRQHQKMSEDEVREKHQFDSEFQMIRHAKIFNKYKKLYALKQNIFNANANPNSYVDTFPKVEYESLFAQ